MKNIVYIKKVDEYDDILKKKHHKLPIFFKEIVYMFKNMFNIITKKRIGSTDIWILPIQEKYSEVRMIKLIRELVNYEENVYVLSEDLSNNEINKLMERNNVSYLKSEDLKKYLVIKILEYINKIQNAEINNMEITLLMSDVSEYNIYLIEKLSKIVKSIKIVTPNIYKFKNLEEKLYNEYGIAIQFSNSYKKALVKSKCIINIDFVSIDINEYEIFDKAIIINCIEENIKIKSKLFNGILINSCNIKFSKDIRDKFKKINLYNKYNSLILYQSQIYEEKDFESIFNKLDEDKVYISNLIGNNGNINKNEIKNIFKKLDK